MMTPIDEKETMNEENKPMAMPGLTAAMEVAGVESIPNATPARIVLGISKED